MVGGFIVAVMTAIMVVPAFAATPASDDFDNATIIASVPFSDSVPIQEATLAADDPEPCFGFAGSDRTVWYAFTPVVSTRFTIELSREGVGVDVFTGSRGDLTKVACLTTSQISSFRFDALSGTEYFIMISARWGWSVELAISIDVAPPGPPNDDFDSATTVNDFTFADEGVHAADAIDAIDDPLCSDWKARHTIWYRYQPPQDVVMTLETTGSVMDGALAVYEGERGSLVQQTNCVYYGYGVQPTLTMSGDAGVTYWIMVGTLSSIGGDVSLHFAARIPSNLDLKASSDTVRYGRSVRLTATLSGFAASSMPLVAIWGRPVGGSERLLIEASAIGGVLQWTTPPLEGAWDFWAVYAGDPPHTAGRDTAHVDVMPILRHQMRGGYGTSGGYRLYHAGEAPRYLTWIVPAHDPRRLCVELSRRAASGWRRAASGCFRMKGGRVGVRIVGFPVGAYRLQTTFSGDRTHLPAKTGFAYFKITR